MDLFEKGLICFFKDYDLNAFLCLQCVATGPFNVYNEPKHRRIYTASGYNKSRVISTSVIIYNNFLRLPTDMTIRLYAQRLAEIERSIDVNLNACKTPVLIKCTENQKQSMKQAYAQYQGNEPVIVADKDINLDGITVMNTKAEYLGDKLTILKHSLWNDAMTFVGISPVILHAVVFI